MTETQTTFETTVRQAEYVDKQLESGHGLGLVFADAFLRGMRDIGYKSPAWALSELIDNSVQAHATTVEFVFGESSPARGGAQPRRLALVDNGAGMIPEMISFAVRWGGTDRENDRKGFGRYGYGLPSAAVSLAKLYSVYSKSPGGEWNRVTVDIDQLAEIANNSGAINDRLQPTKDSPPEWVSNACSELDVKGLVSGTVITFDELDRLRTLSGWRAGRAIEAKCLSQFGLTYRSWLSSTKMFVNSKPVEPIDPLFTNEHCVLRRETRIVAEAVEARSFTIRSEQGEEGNVTIRAAYLPPNFQLANPKHYGKKGAKMNKRFLIMKASNGLHITRDGREIQCVQPPSAWTRFQVYDRNIKIEVDFGPELDELFGITTAKQQITVSSQMWDVLEEEGKLMDLIGDLRKRFTRDASSLRSAAEKYSAKESQTRPSESAMQEAAKFKTEQEAPSTKQLADAEERLQVVANKTSEEQQREPEVVLEELRQESAERPFRIDFIAQEEGPFFRPERLGEQRRILINTAHPFYEKVYSAAPETKAALEVLLFVLAESELDASDDVEAFYKTARASWSERLRLGLAALANPEADLNDSSLATEREEVRQRKSR